MSMQINKLQSKMSIKMICFRKEMLMSIKLYVNRSLWRLEINVYAKLSTKVKKYY